MWKHGNLIFSEKRRNYEKKVRITNGIYTYAGCDRLWTV